VGLYSNLIMSLLVKKKSDLLLFALSMQ
jgi:hypothetical protein